MLLAQRLKTSGWGVIWIALAVLVCCGATMAQDTTASDMPEMCTNPAVLDTVGTGAGGPEGIKVSWRWCNEAPNSPSGYYDSFYVRHSDQPSLAVYDSTPVTGADSFIFRGIAVDKPHWFKVLAYKDNVLGYSTSGPDGADKWIRYDPPSGNGHERPYSLLAPGYWFLEFLVAIGILEPDSLTAWGEASRMGQWAFLFIAVFFAIGMVAWGYKTARTLRSTNVFLIDKEFKKPVKKPKDDVPSGEGESKKPGEEQVKADFVIYNECDAILEHGEFKKLDPSQRKVFSEQILERLTRGSFKGKLKWLNKIPLPEITAKRRMESEELRTNPTARILITAAAAAYEPEGEDGKKVKVDPDRLEKALEIRIYAEEEELRKRSFMDILWALGVTGPLVGLFGTVTGISMSFAKITGLEGKELLEALSKGIHEALYTTVCGLIVGIMFMLAYYWYSYKIERIHAIWVVFAATLVDRFKLDVGDGLSPASDEVQKGS